MTSPIIQRLVLHPRNVFRVQDAVTSLLAGQVFEGVGPLRFRLWFFRLIYYVSCVKSLPTALRAWRRRKRVILAT
jgi:hypothetical protein